MVAAGILRDAAGRVLLAQRTRGEHAGRWEFPGGKAEPGESVEQALRRELQEELGILVGASSALIDVPQQGLRGPWRLCAREVHDYQGEPVGREGQALTWVRLDSLGEVDMPPADLPVAAGLRDPALYCITPDVEPFGLPHLEAGLATLTGLGQPMRLQWRLPRWSRAQALETLQGWLPRLRAARIEVFLNGTPEEAHALGCALHLRSALLTSLEPAALRDIPALSASCHDATQLCRAEALGVDAALLGPVAPTLTHPGATPLGWARFAALRAGCSLPIYALGGLAAGDLATARAHGAQGIAAIRGLWPEPPGVVKD